MIKQKILFPWTKKLVWSLDIQEHLIRMTLSENHHHNLLVKYSEALEITSPKDYDWQVFFAKLREQDKGGAVKLSACLPEVHLLIKPLPEYPYLTKKELHHALRIFQEQVLPWPTENCLRSIRILPHTELQRKREKRSHGYLYALEIIPYRNLFTEANEAGYIFADLSLRSQLYRESLAEQYFGGNLFLLEFFKERIRCHLFQNDSLTHYRDFVINRSYCEYEISETVGSSISDYIQYFSASKEQETDTFLVVCISEEALTTKEVITGLIAEVLQKCSGIQVLPLLSYQQTTNIIDQLSKAKGRRSNHEI